MFKWLKRFFSDDLDDFYERYVIKSAVAQKHDLIVLSLPESKLNEKTIAYYKRMGMKKVTREDIMKAFVVIDTNSKVFKNYWNAKK